MKNIYQQTIPDIKYFWQKDLNIEMGDRINLYQNRVGKTNIEWDLWYKVNFRINDVKNHTRNYL